MSRAIVNVATTPHYRRGQARLKASAAGKAGRHIFASVEASINGGPSHGAVPFAFKAYALKATMEDTGASSLLWCDSCIEFVRPLDPVWEKIERDGYLFMNNGFSNYEWTHRGAYPDLFPGLFSVRVPLSDHDRARERQAMADNKTIPHTVGGFFGLSMKHEIGRQILDDFYRLASETRAFCDDPPGVQQPEGVRGHRHDQTALSVLAWRYGCKLTDAPEFLIYGKAADATDPRTVAVADGSY